MAEGMTGPVTEVVPEKPKRLDASHSGDPAVKNWILGAAIIATMHGMELKALKSSGRFRDRSHPRHDVMYWLTSFKTVAGFDKWSLNFIRKNAMPQHRFETYNHTTLMYATRTRRKRWDEIADPMRHNEYFTGEILYLPGTKELERLTGQPGPVRVWEMTEQGRKFIMAWMMQRLAEPSITR